MRCKTGCDTSRGRGGYRFATTMEGNEHGDFLVNGGYAIEGLRPPAHALQRQGFIEDRRECPLLKAVANIRSGHCLQRRRYPADIDDTRLCLQPKGRR